MKLIHISPYAMPGIRENDRDIFSDAEKAEKIIDKVCLYFGVNDYYVRSKKRDRQYVVPRQWCMYFMKKKTALTLKNIALKFSARDHTTAMYSIEFITGQLSMINNNSFKEDYYNLLQII